MACVLCVGGSAEVCRSCYDSGPAGQLAAANLSLVAEANGLRVELAAARAEANGLRVELAAARQESREMRAALEADPGVIFTDGRQLTTNERHLLNLLSWRVREAEALKDELRRTRGVCDSLAHRCSEQSDLITRRLAERPEAAKAALANVVCQSTGSAK